MVFGPALTQKSNHCPCANTRVPKNTHPKNSCTIQLRGATSSSSRGDQFSWNFIRWRYRTYPTVVQ